MKKLLILCCILCCGSMKAQQALSLAGAWDFATGDETPVAYSDYVMLPGSMLTNGKGDVVSVRTPWTGTLYDSSFYYNPYMGKYRREGAMKFPFFLTPERHYVGRAWYHKRVYVPHEWSGMPVMLFLERPHIETTAWVNGHKVGRQRSLSTPHVYDVSQYLKPGTGNDITICVYNGTENVMVGQDSHSVSDQTQGNWNGIVGRIELQPGPYIWRKKAVPNLEHHYVDITVNEQTVRVRYDAQAELWDEYHPVCYTEVVSYDGWLVPVTFGLRDIRVTDGRLTINGRPLYLRGTVESCCFPETGYPPTDKEEWLRVLGKCKEWGLNHVRFHSYCPPEAAFSAADELGIYLQPEGPSWPNHGVALGRGMLTDEYLNEETRRIVYTYGHHPSFVMMAAGNEPAGDWVRYCNEWVREMKRYDDTKIYAGASVGGGWAWDDGSEYHVKAGARGLDWDKQAPHSDDDYYQQLLFPRNYKGTEPNRSPIIAHEQGQWCAFPDFKEIPQYTGVYKARNFELFQDLLRDHGMQSQAGHFLMSSGRLQVLCYKYEIERNLRTQDYAGFQLLALNDYSGQGTALVGPLNVHWKEKGYCTAREWRQFCSPVVPLARFPRFVFTDSDVVVSIDVYNAWQEPLHQARLTWTVEGLDAKGQSDFMELPVGRNVGVLTIRPLQGMANVDTDIPRKLKLKVMVTADNAPAFHNSWDFWLYPQQVDMPQTKVYETDTLDSSAIDVLQKGGDVLLTAAGKVRYGNDVKHSFLPVFWNTSWFKMRPPHTTGAYIDSRHPVFRHFPTDDWQNLNWWELTHRAQVMNLSEFPADYQPIVQPIDTWHISRKLGMMIEAKVLNGRLLMTTMDISHALDIRPVARQLRYSILKYMDSPDFKPTTTVPVATIRHLYECEAPKVDMFTNESPDELKPKLNN